MKPNPKIQELINLSTERVELNIRGDDTIDAEMVFNKEKFAELIVKECCSKLVEMGEGWLEFANNPPRGQEHNASGALFAAYRLKEDAVNEIQEHFGVG